MSPGSGLYGLVKTTMVGSYITWITAKYNGTIIDVSKKKKSKIGFFSLHVIEQPGDHLPGTVDVTCAVT